MFWGRDTSSSERERGFTLIELLVVVAIIGIITAIAIPNLLNALDRGKQKRTMADLRAVSQQVEIYAVDNSYFPTAGDIATLRAILEPLYAKALPDKDGWNNEIIANTQAQGYTVASQGKDGSGGIVACSGSPRCTDLNDAIIFINGQFAQWPEGQQR